MKKGVDNSTNSPIFLSKRQYQIYFYLTEKYMSQSQIAKHLKLSRETIRKHTDRLEFLGVIKPIKRKTRPRLYEKTKHIPVTDFEEKNTIKISQPLRRSRRGGQNRIFSKTKKKPKNKPKKRDYNTKVFVNGKQQKILRLHSISYICNIIKEPAIEVNWEKKGGIRGMEQFVYHHRFSSDSDVDELKGLDVTFMRKKTKNTDNLVIYMPEKYLLESELDVAKDLLEKYVWKAYRWFQRRFKCHLGMPLQYRDFEVARRISEPSKIDFVKKHGMLKVKNELGYAIVDESKKGFPEREFSSIEAMKIDLNLHSLYFSLEKRVTKLEFRVDKLENNQVYIIKLLEEKIPTFEKLSDIEKRFDRMVKSLEKLEKRFKELEPLPDEKKDVT